MSCLSSYCEEGYLCFVCPVIVRTDMCPVCLVTVRTNILSCLSSYCENGYSTIDRGSASACLTAQQRAT